MRQFFQNQILIPEIPARLEWQNKEWAEALGSLFALIGMFGLLFIYLLIFGD